MNFMVCWGVMPYSLVYGCWRFGGTYCPRGQSRGWQWCIC